MNSSVFWKKVFPFRKATLFLTDLTGYFYACGQFHNYYVDDAKLLLVKF